MSSLARLILGVAFTAAAASPVVADDADALALQSASESSPKGRPFRLYVEGVVGTIDQRGGLGSRSTHRVSIDYSQSFRIGSAWRLNLSDRLDDIQPPGLGVPGTLNSLREAYFGWRREAGETSVDIGRVNVRNGPSYGYNPTDFFRDGALRASTTVDPFALRENRLGTVMLRAQRLWTGGGVSLSLAPKLADAPSSASFSADIGATNSRDKALATVSARLSDRIGAQALLYSEQGKGAQLGASMTALLSDAAVAHFEWSWGRDEDAWARLAGKPNSIIVRNRVSAGLTYALAQQLSITAEFEFNGFAPSQKVWRQAGADNSPLLGAYVLDAQRRQDNASRKAWLLYATQKSVFLKNLDATALLRVNDDDNSRLGWLELRHHWTGLDGAIQWQWSRGTAKSQFGLNPVKQSIQALIGVYF